MKKILLIIGLALFLSGCASEPLTGKCPPASTLYHKIAEDVLSRITPDFYFYKEKSRTIEKLVTDCDFQDVDLNDDGEAEIIVKENWFEKGNDKFPEGFNSLRGASGNGEWDIYSVTNDNINYLGTMTDGNQWKLLSTKTNGYENIETWAHESYNEITVDTYRFSNGEYRQVSSVLYELNEDGSRIKKLTADDFRKLKLDDVLADTSLFDDIYYLNSQKRISVLNKEIKLELYYNCERHSYYGNFPISIIAIKSGGNEIKLPLGSKLLPLDKSYLTPKTNEPILCIYNASGGNAWNANPIYVISLEDKYFLKNLGQVSGVYDVDGDGIDDLVVYDDTWEGGLGAGIGLMGHSGSPYVKIILKIKEGKIVPAVNDKLAYYQSEIRRINTKIKGIPQKVSDLENLQLLSLSLEKFLIYRLLGNTDKGWAEFNKDMKDHDIKFFYDGKKKVTIEEIVNQIRKSLK